jgi:iron-sulfur cluster assembly accessory protein
VRRRLTSARQILFISQVTASNPPGFQIWESGEEHARSPFMTMVEDRPRVGLTERAARRIAEIVAGEPGADALRVSVEGGGCSGFQYKFDLVSGREPDDLVIEREGAVVLIDEMSVGYMEGSEIDFVDELIGASFKIQNPNATAACGCGTSFSI